MLNSPNLKNGKDEIKEYQDIEKIESILVYKTNIENFLKKKNLTKTKLRRAASKIRNKNWKKGVHSKYLQLNLKDNFDIWFYNTPKIKKTENPINLLVKKKDLIELSRNHYIFTKKSFKKLI